MLGHSPGRWALFVAFIGNASSARSGRVRMAFSGCIMTLPFAARRGSVTQADTTVAESDVYYDPYDFAIDEDPYPVWKRLREERPLYYNDKYDFYAVSRYTDVDTCSTDWKTYSSAKGTVLELVKANIEIPPGSIIFEDPPAHTIHRGLLARVFRPKAIADLEPKVRQYC